MLSFRFQAGALFIPTFWSGCALVVWLLLPLGRQGRAFLPLDYGFHATALPVGAQWLLPFGFAIALICALSRGTNVRLAADVSTCAAFLAAFGIGHALVSGGIPFGWGALLSIVALLLAAGAGLSAASRIKGDAFAGGAVVLCIVFVSLFIVYPLALVMWSAVRGEGGPSSAPALQALTSPLFLLLDNPHSEISETGRVGLCAGLGAALAALRAVLVRPAAHGPGRGFLWTPLEICIGGFVGGLLGLMIYGKGALPSSLLLAGIVAPASTLLGLCLALLSQRTACRPLRGVLGIASVLPFITPPFVIGFAIIFLLGRRGLISHGLLGIAPLDNPLYGILGVAVAQVLALAPVSYLILRGALNGLDPRLEEAGQTMGARRSQVFCTVTWPLLRPGLAVCLLLATIESISDFGTPLILGGDRNFLASEVYLSLTGRYSQSEAAVYSAVLLTIVALIFVTTRLIVGVKGYATVTGKPAKGRFMPLPPMLEAGLWGVTMTWFCLVVMLYLTVIYGSLVEIWGIDNRLTLRHYQDFWQQGWPVLLNTMKLAFASAVPAMALGLMVSYLVSRYRFVGRRYLEFAALLSFATPGTVMGLAYVLAFNDGALLMTGTSAVIVLALIARNAPVAIQASNAGLSQIDRSLEEASASLGAGSGQTLIRVLAPLLLYPLLAGLIYAFVAAMTTVSQVIFLVGPGNNLATVLLLSWVEQGHLGRAAAMATVMIIGLLGLILFAIFISRRADIRSARKDAQP